MSTVTDIDSVALTDLIAVSFPFFFSCLFINSSPSTGMCIYRVEIQKAFSGVMSTVIHYRIVSSYLVLTVIYTGYESPPHLGHILLNWKMIQLAS